MIDIFVQMVLKETYLLSMVLEIRKLEGFPHRHTLEFF
jgi:hypothetical protein